MSIKKLNLAHLRNDAHFQFHTAFRDLAVKHTPQALKIAPLWGAYLTHYRLEDEALKKIVKSDLTRRIQEADAARDEVFAGMSAAVSAACKHFNAAVRAAAMRVQVVFDTYGNVARKPLNEETSAIYNLLQDLMREKYAEDVSAVGATEWAQELQRLNAAFDALVTKRFEETGERSDIVLKSERAALDDSYKKIVTRINALEEVEGAGAYKEFIDTLNAIISKYASMRPRHHRVGKGEEGGEAA
jgi:hypothetical protein